MKRNSSTHNLIDIMLKHMDSPETRVISEAKEQKAVKAFEDSLHEAYEPTSWVSVEDANQELSKSQYDYRCNC